MTTKNIITTNHNEIRQWIEDHGGKPCHIKRIGEEGIGMLQISFKEKKNASLEELSWDDFFEKFEQKKLAFLYEEREEGGESRFFRFIKRQQPQKES